MRAYLLMIRDLAVVAICAAGALVTLVMLAVYLGESL